MTVVDLTRKQALNLSVQQTLSAEDTPTEAMLIDQYLHHIRPVQPTLLASETYLCIDGGLTRKKLIDGVYLYTAGLNHVRFQRTLRVVALINPEADNPSQPILLFCTDPDLDAWKIYH